MERVLMLWKECRYYGESDDIIERVLRVWIE